MNERATFWELPLGNLNISQKLSVIVTKKKKNQNQKSENFISFEFLEF